jgi:hypothetical protein
MFRTALQYGRGAGGNTSVVIDVGEGQGKPWEGQPPIGDSTPFPHCTHMAKHIYKLLVNNNLKNVWSLSYLL